MAASTGEGIAAAAQRYRTNSGFKYRPVKPASFFATSSGVPIATSVPPPADAPTLNEKRR
jgi:hypothetical protein